MAEMAKIGTDWRDDELDAIVADYFAMLAAELSGRPYVKTQYSKALTAAIGRPHGSVEFKHQNISAVLDEIGMPWIAGYKPRKNYQVAIFDAIDRYLSRSPEILYAIPPSTVTQAPHSGVFVPMPLLESRGNIPERLERLIRKFDPVERDYRNCSLGRAGEQFVFDLEQRRLAEINRSDLAHKVRWIAEEEGDGAGYDILSFEPSGRERFVEVKTTNGSARTPFFLTRNERELAQERKEDWCVFRVHLFSTEPHIFTIRPPLEAAVHLSPETWRASFSGNVL